MSIIDYSKQGTDFEKILVDLYQTESYKAKARELGEKIKSENRESQLIEMITG